jgi:hypothetical protein
MFVLNERLYAVTLVAFLFWIAMRRWPLRRAILLPADVAVPLN